MDNPAQSQGAAQSNEVHTDSEATSDEKNILKPDILPAVPPKFYLKPDFSSPISIEAHESEFATVAIEAHQIQDEADPSLKLNEIEADIHRADNQKKRTRDYAGLDRISISEGPGEEFIESEEEKELENQHLKRQKTRQQSRSTSSVRDQTSFNPALYQNQIHERHLQMKDVCRKRVQPKSKILAHQETAAAQLGDCRHTGVSTIRNVRDNAAGQAAMEPNLQRLKLGGVIGEDRLAEWHINASQVISQNMSHQKNPSRQYQISQVLKKSMCHICHGQFGGSAGVTSHITAKHAQRIQTKFIYPQLTTLREPGGQAFIVECPICPKPRVIDQTPASDDSAHLVIVHCVMVHSESELNQVGLKKMHMLKDLILNYLKDKYHPADIHPETNWPTQLLNKGYYWMNLRAIFKLATSQMYYIANFRQQIDAYWPANRPDYDVPFIQDVSANKNRADLIKAKLPLNFRFKTINDFILDSQ